MRLRRVYIIRLECRGAGEGRRSCSPARQQAPTCSPSHALHLRPSPSLSLSLWPPPHSYAPPPLVSSHTQHTTLLSPLPPWHNSVSYWLYQYQQQSQYFFIKKKEEEKNGERKRGGRRKNPACYFNRNACTRPRDSMSCSLCKCPWKWMPKHPGGNQCCSPRRGIRTTQPRRRQAGGEKSATACHREWLIGQFPLSSIAPFDDGSDCRFRRAASIYWRLRRPARSSLPVSACNKASSPGGCMPGRLLPFRRIWEGRPGPGSPRRTPAGTRRSNLFFIRRGKQAKQ